MWYNNRAPIQVSCSPLPVTCSVTGYKARKGVVPEDRDEGFPNGVCELIQGKGNSPIASHTNAKSHDLLYILNVPSQEEGGSQRVLRF